MHNIKYQPEDVKCQYCTEHSGTKGCKVQICPWMTERIEAGVVGYAEAVRGTFPRDTRLNAQLRKVIQRFTGSLWLNEDHHQRMENLKARQGYRQHRDTPAYFAAMYLLTANQDLFTRTANCFCRHGIEFGYAILRDIPPHGYTLFSAARDIYTKTEYITLGDLASREIVDTKALILIVNATLIARYGCAVLKICDREGKS